MEEALTVPSGDCGKAEEARKDEQLKGRSGDLLRGLVLRGGGEPQRAVTGLGPKEKNLSDPREAPPLSGSVPLAASWWRSHSRAAGRTAGLRPRVTGRDRTRQTTGGPIGGLVTSPIEP